MHRRKQWASGHHRRKQWASGHHTVTKSQGLRSTIRHWILWPYLDITVTHFKSEIKSQATHSLDVPCQAPQRACTWSLSPLTWRTLWRAELCFWHMELQLGFSLKPQDIAPIPTGQLHQHLTATCTTLKVKQAPSYSLKVKPACRVNNMNISPHAPLPLFCQMQQIWFHAPYKSYVQPPLA